MYSIEGKISALKANGRLGDVKYTINEDIHGYAKKIASARNRLQGMWEGEEGLGFLDVTALMGLSPGRQCFYIDRIWGILGELETRKKRLKSMTKKDCMGVMAVFAARDIAGETKFAYALALQRLVHYSKTGELGIQGKYCKEISWIIPSMYKEKHRTIQKTDLITPEEFHKMASKARNVRDRALLWVLYEGAYRPGELLNMRVGGVEFAEKYVMVSTSGKTGQKNLALVTSFRPLLEWYETHPLNDDPNAPLWYSPWRETGCLSYDAIRKIVADTAKAAGIKKRIWMYMLRHAQLTELSKKLPDQLLRVYGNWTPGSKMTAQYTHLSAQDAKNAILELHGIKAEDPDTHSIRVCPRCEGKTEPDRPLCGRCGYMLNDSARSKITLDDVARSRIRDKITQTHDLEKKIDVLFEEVLDSAKVRPKW